MSSRRWAGVVLAAGAVLGATSCTSTPVDDGVFTPGPATAAECMEHQPQSPGAAYTGQSPNKLGLTLAVFRYYAQNGTKPYCDGAGPTAVDKQWAQFVVDAQGPVSSVQAILDAPAS